MNKKMIIAGLLANVRRTEKVINSDYQRSQIGEP